MSSSKEKTPVALLSGFLGAGKTTLLNRLLQREEFADTLVIINEFGETSLDHLLVENSTETIFELSNGCLCCSVQGELVDTLANLDRSNFKRILIETTGIANPLPVFQSIAFHPQLVEDYQPASINIVVDALRGKELIEAHEEASKQLACADNIIFSKMDLAENVDALETFVRSQNETASIITNEGDISINLFKQVGIEKKASHHHADDHESAYKSIVLETKNPLSTSLVAGFVHHLASLYGENLLRIKGFVLNEENPESPMVVQTSGQILHDFTELETWPNTTHQTTLVVIIKGANIEMAKQAFDSFTNSLAIDTPDRQAMTENPLAIPGF